MVLLSECRWNQHPAGRRCVRAQVRRRSECATRTVGQTGDASTPLRMTCFAITVGEVYRSSVRPTRQAARPLPSPRRGGAGEGWLCTPRRRRIPTAWKDVLDTTILREIEGRTAMIRCANHFHPFPGGLQSETPKKDNLRNPRVDHSRLLWACHFLCPDRGRRADADRRPAKPEQWRLNRHHVGGDPTGAAAGPGRISSES